MDEFLDSLPSDDRKKVLMKIKFIGDTWPARIPSQSLKKLKGTEEIWEIRVKGHDNIFRVFCFFFTGVHLVLTHGYVKKDRKTDPREIDKAERCRREYIERRRK